MQNRCLKLFIHTITNPHFSLYMDILRSNIDFFFIPTESKWFDKSDYFWPWVAKIPSFSKER